MLTLVAFYVCKLIKAKIINTQVIKLKKVVKHYSQACYCIVLMFYTALGSFFLVSPLVEAEKLLRGFSFCWLFTSIETQPGFS